MEERGDRDEKRGVDLCFALPPSSLLDGVLSDVRGVCFFRCIMVKWLECSEKSKTNMYGMVEVLNN